MLTPESDGGLSLAFCQRRTWRKHALRGFLVVRQRPLGSTYVHCKVRRQVRSEAAWSYPWAAPRFSGPERRERNDPYPGVCPYPPSQPNECPRCFSPARSSLVQRRIGHASISQSTCAIFHTATGNLDQTSTEFSRVGSFASNTGLARDLWSRQGIGGGLAR